ncbi:MAG: ATP-binding protein [Acidobacteria bacterium]|nr:ATP-binding protein [Acidobacteriota bacterium]MYH30845.1 ATP-binding protein [Acidobacteriota bacterium]
MTYLPRIVDAELAELLEAAGAVLVEGPRATGKTATAARAAASEVLLDVDDNARRMIGADPAAVLDGDTPRLIDEWQLEPAVWNHVRREIDRRGAPGQFILTGSAVPAEDVARHTGAGRFVRLRMRPLSLYESGRSSGKISLRRLLEGAEQRAGRSESSIADIAESVCAGGWPGHVGKPLPGILRVNRGYLDDVRRTDVSRASGKTRDPVKVGRLLRSLARNVATPVSLSKLAAEVGEEGRDIKTDTVAEYLDALERLMVVENQPAWSPHLRSRTTLRQTAVRHFVDPSLAVAALRATPARLTADLEFLGLLFESLVVRDLRVHAQAADAQVFHYREKDGLEVDAVVEAADGRWAAFEIKLGERWVDDGAKSLRRLARRLENSDHGAPAALAVIVPTGYGYVKAGDVGVIPIGALGP